ncbi:MAG TPA: 3-deoxy-8-phosphooctulonate synthase [Cryomorphaceae bacterium]|nr:3-deoxy-8-phosphooctulonate synthase [Cryomorphaceae bacterium]HCY24901.1 3-deoxy-8-phosphooctulonate synthase [Cryomorphaceae bacterium]|tara:strand:+ start:887 stop:1720 length:834 start_codon:yes stop_codon:yes gene_type:complete
MSDYKVPVGNHLIGGDTFTLISGPCVIEEESIMMKVAEQLAQYQSKHPEVHVIYKSSFQKDNRSSIDFYSGPGLEEGLRILQKVKDEFGFSLITDIHYPDQAAPAGEVVDIIQIPAYLCMQTELVLAAARTGKAVNLKHGQFLAPQNMVKPVAKIESTGNKNIILTERGFTFGYNDLIVDPRAFYDLRQSGYPVIFDITHSIRKYGIPSSDPNGGLREYLPTLARAGVAAGVDGVFIETHPCPSEALCDAASQLDITQLESFMEPLLAIHNIEKQYR